MTRSPLNINQILKKLETEKIFPNGEEQNYFAQALRDFKTCSEEHLADPLAGALLEFGLQFAHTSEAYNILKATAIWLVKTTNRKAAGKENYKIFKSVAEGLHAPVFARGVFARVASQGNIPSKARLSLEEANQCLSALITEDSCVRVASKLATEMTKTLTDEAMKPYQTREFQDAAHELTTWLAQNHTDMIGPSAMESLSTAARGMRLTV